MIKLLMKLIKDSFQKKESFFICEETRYHPIVDEVSNSFMVIYVLKIKNIKISEQILFSDLKTIEDAEKYLKVYKQSLKKKKSAGIVLIKENSE